MALPARGPRVQQSGGGDGLTAAAISALPAASALAGAEEIPAAQSGAAKKTTPNALLDFIAASMTRLSGRVTSAPTFASGSVTSNIATITTVAAHNLLTDQVLTISGSTGVTVDGTFSVTVTGPTTFTFAIVVGNGTITAATITPRTVIQIGHATNPLQGFVSTDEVVLTTSDNGKRIALHLGGYFGYGAVGSFNNNYDNQYFGLQATQLVIAADGNLRVYSGTNAFDPAFADSFDLGSSGRKWNNLFSAGYLEFKQVSSGGTPASNCGRIYAKDVAGTAELFVMDEAGNETQISPHRMDGPAWLYDTDDPLPRVSWEAQHFLGVIRYVNRSRLERLIMTGVKPTTATGLATTCIHVESFSEFNTRTAMLDAPLVPLDWHETQRVLQEKYETERAKELSEFNERLGNAAKNLAAKETVLPLLEKAVRDGAPQAEIVELFSYSQTVEPNAAHFSAARTLVQNDVRPAEYVRKPMPVWMQARFAALNDPRETVRPTILGKLRSWLGF